MYVRKIFQVSILLLVCLLTVCCESVPMPEQRSSGRTQEIVFTNGVDAQPYILSLLKEKHLSGGIVNHYFDYALIETGWERVFGLIDLLGALCRQLNDEYSQSEVRLSFYIYEGYVIVRGTQRQQRAGNVSFESMMGNGKSNGQKKLHSGMKGWSYLESITKDLRLKIELAQAQKQTM